VCLPCLRILRPPDFRLERSGPPAANPHDRR
jgi:hypothetical protein